MNSISSQRGAALIYVLLVLLIILIAGTYAIRQGIVSLKISTNSQVQALLSQSNNSALYKIQSPQFLKSYLSLSGMFGFILQPQNVDKEMVFCFKSSTQNYFDVLNASVIYMPLGTTAINNDSSSMAGYCNPNSNVLTNFFTSSRKAILTQVTIRQIANENLTPLSDAIEGTDSSNLSLVNNRASFKVYVVSLLPKLSSASDSDIYACLSEHMSQPPATATVQTTPTDCLAALGIPYDSQTVILRYTPNISSS